MFRHFLAFGGIVILSRLNAWQNNFSFDLGRPKKSLDVLFHKSGK
jgi:hypothetical protein